jgi:hypothetical protein
MSTSALRALDELARLYIQRRDDPEVQFRMRLVPRTGLEPIVGELTALAVRSIYSVGQRADDLATALLGDDELSTLRPINGQLDPFIAYPGGGHRLQLGLMAGQLLGGAVAQCMIRGLTQDEPTVRSLLEEAFDDLKHGISGGSVTSYGVYGLTGIDIKGGLELNTPW